MRTWLVTGTSRGLGRALAEAILAAGDNLLATARYPRTVAGLVQRYGDAVMPFALDVTDQAAAERAVAAAVERFGQLDVVVNNAGYANLGSLEDTPPHDFRAQIETDLFGVVNVTRAALPVMRTARSGHIIQVSSIGGRLATPGLSAYQAAKWAVGGFSEVVAEEVRPLGIRVTVIEPGGMPTEWALASMRIHDVTEGYEDSVGRWTAFFHESRARHQQGAQTAAGQSDPAKVAEVVLRLVDMTEPPIRLVLGADAYAAAVAAREQRAAEDERWRELSHSTGWAS